MGEAEATKKKKLKTICVNKKKENQFKITSPF